MQVKLRTSPIFPFTYQIRTRIKSYECSVPTQFISLMEMHRVCDKVGAFRTVWLPISINTGNQRLCLPFINAATLTSCEKSRCLNEWKSILKCGHFLSETIDYLNLEMKPGLSKMYIFVRSIFFLNLIRYSITATEHCHPGTKRCYWETSASSGWSAGRTACQSENGDLAVVETEELFNYVLSEFR